VYQILWLFVPFLYIAIKTSVTTQRHMKNIWLWETYSLAAL